MNIGLWRAGFLFSLVLGLGLVFSPYMAMLAVVFVVVTTARIWWYRDFPGIWQYGMKFLAYLLGLAFGGAGIFGVVCKILSYTSISLSSCDSFGLDRALMLFASLIMILGIPFWLWHMWVVWKIRRN